MNSPPRNPPQNPLKISPSTSAGEIRRRYRCFGVSVFRCFGVSVGRWVGGSVGRWGPAAVGRLAPGDRERCATTFHPCQLAITSPPRDSVLECVQSSAALSVMRRGLRAMELVLVLYGSPKLGWHNFGRAMMGRPSLVEKQQHLRAAVPRGAANLLRRCG